MEFDRQVMGKNRECVRFCFIVFCFIAVPEVAEIGLRRIRRGPQLPNASRHAPRRLSRLLRSGISSRGGTAPRDGVREHVRGALPGRRRRVPRAARVLRAPIQLGRRAPTLKDNLHVSARSVLTGRNSLRINLVQHNGTAACIADPYCARALRRSWNLARQRLFRQISGHAVLEFDTRVPSVSHTPRHMRPRAVLTVRTRDRPS